MGSQSRKWTGNALAKSQVWALTPPVTPDAPTWNITLNGKTLSYKSNGTAADAATGMQALWATSRFPEFLEIAASVPTATNPPDNPQGLGTNEIQAAYVSGAPTGGSFQLAWGGSSTPFLVDPQTPPTAIDGGSAGSPNGVYKYVVTFLNVNPFGAIGETLPSAAGAVTVSNRTVAVGLPLGQVGTVGRRIYRTAAGGAPGTEKLLATVWDNTTTSYLDNVADGALGAAAPTANSTGLPLTISAAELQTALQSLAPIGLGNLVVSGEGIAADPWLLQFTGSLAATKQAMFAAGSCSFIFAPSVPAVAAPALNVTEIQQGLQPNAAPPTDGNTLLLVGKAGVPFYLTSQVTGKIAATVSATNVTPPAPPSTETISVTAVPPTISVARLTTGQPGQNEIQRISIAPNAESGSTFTLTVGGDTTGAIPTPPSAPTATAGGAGNLGTSGGAKIFYWRVTFYTALGETEPSLPSAALSCAGIQAALTIPTGASVVLGRRIYRTLGGGDVNGPYYLTHAIADNTTTSYTDDLADGSLALSPLAPTTNGALQGALAALASVGAGNVQVSGANAASYLGMTLQQSYSASPPPLSTAASTTAAPTTLTATAGGGGSLSAGEYFYVVTALDADGETAGAGSQQQAAVEVSVLLLGATNSVALSWTPSTGAKGFRVYRGPASGQENLLVAQLGPTATSFIDYGDAPSALDYDLEYVGELAAAPQTLPTASVAGVTVLPTISLVELQTGYPVQNERQLVGWRQQYGFAPAGGTFTLKFPSLNVTTAPMTSDATSVASAIQAALPPQYADGVSVKQLLGVGQNASNLEFIVALSFSGALGGAPLPQTQIDLTAMSSGTADDVLSPVEQRSQVGSSTGRDEIVKVTLNNSPSGGTFGLTGYLADGNAISVSGLVANATAAMVQAAFPAATVAVSGNAGGPYTLQAVGESGAQRVFWQAASSLTGASSVPGSPPTTNTTQLPAPSFSLTAGTSGALAAGNYRYAVTVTNAEGETTGAVQSVLVVAGGSVSISWGAVAEGAGYRIYRGDDVAPNKLIATISSPSQTTFIDTGVSTPTSATPPASSTAPISPPVLAAPTAGTSGTLAAATYFYVVTARNSLGETTASNERAVVVSANGNVSLSWAAVTGATSYDVYRGTTAGGENLLISNTTNLSFIDSGAASETSGSPPASNTTGIAAPVLTSIGSGGASYYGYSPGVNEVFFYKITALNGGGGETAPSNELSINVGEVKGQTVTLNWNPVTGAASYNVYRGTTTGGESVLVANVPQSSLGKFIDTFAPPPASGNGGKGSSTSLSYSIINGGSLPPGTYYYTSSEADNEIEVVLTAGQGVALTITGAARTVSISRGTSPGGENLIVGVINNDQTEVTFFDSGQSPVSGTPPSSDTTLLTAPVLAAPAVGTNGLLAATTYYYKATAFDSAGETAGSNEVSATTTGSFGDVQLSWGAISHAEGIRVYRGTAAGAENELIATLAGSATGYCDTGASSAVSQAPPSVNTTGISPPVQAAASVGSSGLLAAGTRFYVVTAYNSQEESLASNEISATTTGSFGSVQLNWTPPPNTTGFKVYRGTTSGGENSLLATLAVATQDSFVDDGESTATSSSPPSLNTTEISAPVLASATPSATGGQLVSGTFYYEVTALDMYGETTASNELSAVVTGPTGSVALVWGVVAGATSYKVYRGLTSGGENGLLATVVGGGSTGYTDEGGSPATFSAAELYLGAAPADEVQTVTVNGAAGGTFSLGMQNQDTTALAAGASAAMVQAALGSLSTVGAGNCSVALAVSNGIEVYTVTFSGSLAGESQSLLTADGSKLLGGTEYFVALSAGAADDFTLAFGGVATSPLSPEATASAVQTALQGLASIGAGNATVSGAAGGPWSVSLASSVAVASDALSGSIVSQTSSGATSVTYVIAVGGAASGSFAAVYGTSVSIPFNATAPQVQSLLETTSIGAGNVAVSGVQGGPWTATITPTVQNGGLTLSVSLGSLVGSNAVAVVYPLVFAMAVGPNFFDAAANWDSGEFPAAYLTPPTIQYVAPVSTDATLENGTHGSLTSGTTYYYKVSATNANGETNGSTEASGIAFAGAQLYFNGAPAAGTFTLSYGGQTTGAIAYNATAATIQGALQSLSSIGSGNCIVTGSGTSANPFVFQLGGTFAGAAPTPLSANSSGLTGATISVYNLDARSLAIAWNAVAGASAYNVYRSTAPGVENLLVATIPNPDQTMFVDDGTYTTTAGSPASAANSYNTAVGDDVSYANSNVSCLYDVGASVVNGYSIRGGYNGANYPAFNSLTVDATFTGQIGLPAANPSGYQEYRPLALEINGPPGADMAVEIGGGSGQGSSFINLDTGASQVSISVSGAAPSTGTTPAVLWIGANAANEVNLYRGSMGIGYYPGQTYQVGTVRQSYIDNPASDTSLIMGAGGTGITLFVQSGGDCQLSASVATIVGKGGALTQDGGGVTTLLNLSGTNYVSRSTGAIAALQVSASGEFDRSQDGRALSIGSVSLYAGATYLDPHGCTVTTGQGYLAYSLIQCGYEDVTLELGKNVSAQRTQD